MKKIFSYILGGLIFSLFACTQLLAQGFENKEIYVFHKNGSRDILPVTEQTRLEFEKVPFVNEENIFEGDTIFFPASSWKSDYFYFHSNYPLTVQTSEDWVFAHVINYKYEADPNQKIIRLWTKPNYGNAERTAQLVVANTAGTQKTFTIVQRQKQTTFETSEYINNGRFDGPVSLTKETEVDWIEPLYYRNWLETYSYKLQISDYIHPCWGLQLIDHPSWLTKKSFYANDAANDTIDYDAFYQKVVADSLNDPGRVGGLPTISGASFELNNNLKTTALKGAIIYKDADGQQLINNVTQKGVSIQAIYNNWNYLLPTSTGNIIDHMQVGFGGIMMLSDVMSNDMSLFMDGDPWKYDHQLEYGSEQYVRARYVWDFFYRIIALSNQYLGALWESKDAAEYRPLVGQLYAFRGLSYFYLAQFFQHTYATSKDQPCVPIVLTEYEDSIHSRASVAQVFAQAEADLLQAEELLDNWQRSNKGEIDQQVVQGLLSRLYLVMNEWVKAAEKAHAARQNADLFNLNEVATENYLDLNNREAIWGLDVTEENSRIYASYQSWMSAQSVGYGGQVGAFKLIDKKLFNSIPAADQRNALFYSNDTQYDSQYGSWTIPALANKKFKDVSNFLGDVVYMRAAELYLNEIEALYMAGKKSEARSLFNEFILTRNSNFNGSFNKDEIRKQRRIELWGEGFSYFDHRRWQMNLDRNYEGNNENAENYPVDIAWNDAKWRYQIPRYALGITESLTADHQNDWEAQPESNFLDINKPEASTDEPNVGDKKVYVFDFSSVESIESALPYRLTLEASHSSAQPFTACNVSSLFGENTFALVSSVFDNQYLFDQLQGNLICYITNNIAGMQLDLSNAKEAVMQITALQMQALYGYNDYPGHFDVYISDKEITTLDDLNNAQKIGSSKDNSDYCTNYWSEDLCFAIPEKYWGTKCYFYIQNKACYQLADGYDEYNWGMIILGMQLNYLGEFDNSEEDNGQNEGLDLTKMVKFSATETSIAYGEVYDPHTIGLIWSETDSTEVYVCNIEPYYAKNGFTVDKGYNYVKAQYLADYNVIAITADSSINIASQYELSCAEGDAQGKLGHVYLYLNEDKTAITRQGLLYTIYFKEDGSIGAEDAYAGPVTYTIVAE